MTPIYVIAIYYIVDPRDLWRLSYYKRPTSMRSSTNMASNFYPNHFAHPPQSQREPAQQAAYLLGMGPMPPPRPQEVAVAAAMHLLNHNSPDDSDEENIDPQLRRQEQTQAYKETDTQVTVRIPINNSLTRDIDFSTAIPCGDFLDRIFAAMNLDPTAAQLGWKTNDEPKRAPAHQLSTPADIDNAFKTLTKMKSSTRRQKEVVMVIVHLNPTPPEVAKKKVDGNRITDFAYSAELRIVQEKLRCALHAGPNRWCYVSPDHPADHIPLGYEEISLWARKIHDNSADPDCITPPHCLRLDDLRQRASRVRKPNTKTDTPPIHVHINNGPLGNSRITNNSPSPTRGLKRLNSSTSDSSEDSNAESLSLSLILDDLDVKFPKLNLPQYMPLLEEKGIVYVESVFDFDRKYYIDLGLAEGAVGPFLGGVKKALARGKREKKRAKVNKENRSASLEI
ncbi:uncharacterized protein LACBIDRAFT_311891 [Laccaria bicolor S238N-H82]|uniref:Predicted protein n=1 Tax=Laccaria bicolor (strain S238N-H82 / ATCC MYA-4686) TaxID=486041 RepID=B0CYJ8_LACBS|nr:uncharacterized protein LACBIDRAFT_311891 [Laccaria bicolor S238N-H82]EDR12464.1 predicted protein [Laccaria bicolor S238N-H82]|eukprot:XP_001876728.1 predicted protein [Laccaria bicolor S238N-H82]